MADGPELKGFVIYKYKCTNCRWFRRRPHPNQPGENITDCYHPDFTQGQFPGYSLGGSDDTPTNCPILRR